ncbi:DUF726-domain-containing protein [Tilletiaria anomala UBC 951]|uniref:DUF726-domain-containing protein n=1 Tax=Tilletiaria anomala (strain ATCC 24038 / CBS 436.72 / UBC 951) TaxID=1037660 RepID=A0A066VPE7_TILAU|nr:DUF726-domain-containing protein [Tilletiaria anomala UBC 951]KDN43321.1 DUF726-domain-containing protein [Tilletiaria anomala UBC 951]
MASVKDPPQETTTPPRSSEDNSQPAEKGTRGTPPASEDARKRAGETESAGQDEKIVARPETPPEAIKEVPEKVSIPILAPPPPPRTSSNAAASSGSGTKFESSRGARESKAGAGATANLGDDGEWQDMPVIRTLTEEDEHYAVLDEEDRKKYRYKVSNNRRFEDETGLPGTLQDKRKSGAIGNATGRHLDIDDARGYDWRSKPAGIDLDESEEEEQGRGYTQIQLQEDEEAERLHAATEYLFNDVTNSPLEGPSVTPANQMATTKQLLTEGQRIAYVGLCSLLAKDIKAKVVKGPKGNDLKEAAQSADHWIASTMSKLYVHMDVEGPEKHMIEMLGEHGVFASDLAANLATTQTIDNPDFDPRALAEREEMERKEAKEAEEAKEKVRIQVEEAQANASSGKNPDGLQGDATSGDSSEPPPAYEAKEEEEGEMEEIQDDGDIGAQLQSPRPARKSIERPFKAAKILIDKRDEATLEETDIGCGAQTQRAPQPDAGDAPDGTHDQGLSMDTVQASPGTRAKVLLDPNTMAQVNADNLKADGQEASKAQQEVSKTLGLTSQPQAVQPPPNALEGVTTEISTADRTITLDIRWTVLCDLFLLLISEANYDARSRVLLENVAQALGLTWLDVTKFEKRVADTLEIEEGVEKLKDQSLVEERAAQAKKKRLLMMGLATVGGGLVIGLSAGLLAPLIGLGLGTALGTIGIGGTTAFLGGAGGAALITTTATLGGAQMAGRGMSKRTRSVRTFEFKTLHNKKRFNCIIGIPGFMSGEQDDPRLPFSVIDSMMGDLFTVLWEPDMMKEMGNAIGILWNETIGSGVQQVLAVTFASALVGALAWPIWLSKLGYLIDNPWSNALDRARAAGLILADVLSKKQMGARPITLVGFSLGARVIYYALTELYRKNSFGIVQNVYLIGAPVSANVKNWTEVRSVVSGRFVNGYSTSDWILGYLHRATTGGLSTVAGLHPIQIVPDIDNVDLTHIVPGHLAYRALMPLVLGELGFRTIADYFDEPEELSQIPEREVVLEPTNTAPESEQVPQTSTFASFFRRKNDVSAASPSPAQPLTHNLEQNLRHALSKQHTSALKHGRSAQDYDYEYDEDADADEEGHADKSASPGRRLPPYPAESVSASSSEKHDLSLDRCESTSVAPAALERERDSESAVVFDTDLLLEELRRAGVEVKELETSLPPLATSTVQPKEKAPVRNDKAQVWQPELQAPLVRPTDLAPSQSHQGGEHSLSGSGMHTSTSADRIRDRTLGKPLPSFGSETSASTGWGSKPSGGQPAPVPSSAWSVEEPPAPVSKDFAFSAPSPAQIPRESSISMTFASYDDEEISAPVGPLHEGYPGHSPCLDPAHTFPQPPGPQLSFGGHDGSISFADNPWQ